MWFLGGSALAGGATSNCTGLAGVGFSQRVVAGDKLSLCRAA